MQPNSYPPQPGYGPAPQTPSTPYGYVPNTPQQYAPPPAQQAYQQAQAGYQATPPVAPVQPGADVPLNIVEPGGGGGEWAPAARHLYGRAVIGIPRLFDANNQYQGQARPSVTVDFVVVSIGPDGSPVGPLEYGDSQARDGTARPNCFRVDDMVAEFTGAKWNNQQIVEYVAPLVGTGSLFMGRFVQGTQGNKPPLINALAPDDPARQMLIEAWRQRTAAPGSLKRTPVEINGGPPKKADQQAAPTGAYGVSAAQQYGQQPGYGGPPAPPGVPQGAQVQYPGYPPAPAQPVPPAALAQGWTPETWAQAPSPVKAQYGA